MDTSMPDDPSWWKELWPNPKNVINSLGIEPAMISVDLCCGYGYFTPFLAELSSKVYAIELDGKLLEKARMENQNIKNCLWIQGDAMDIADLIQEKVKFVFLANTLHGVYNKEKLCKSIFSILEEGGKLAIVNWKKKRQEETILFGFPTGPKLEMRMDLYEINSILNPLGFLLNKAVDLPPHHYGAIFIKK